MASAIWWNWPEYGSWNEFLYRELKGIPGIALDLHRYRGRKDATPGPNDTTPMTPQNIDALMRTGLSQRFYLTVDPPYQWPNGRGGPMPTVLLENAIQGYGSDHATRSDAPWPWPVVMAHADLTREALASPAMSFLGWTWFPENLPKEWPHGAIRNGTLAKHALAQAFLSTYHRGLIVASLTSDDAQVRAIASRFGRDRRLHYYGSNFSRLPRRLDLMVRGASPSSAQVEIMTESGTTSQNWQGATPLLLPPMSLFRIRFGENKASTDARQGIK